MRFIGPLKEALSERAFTTEELQDFVKSCYLAERSERLDETSALIKSKVSGHVNSVLSYNKHDENRKFIGYCLSPSAMSSLRDIDRSVWVNLDSDTYAALKTGKIYSTRTGGE